MPFKKKHRLALVTIIFWFLFLYIIAALMWWFIALNNQNAATTAMRLAEINKDDIDYVAKTEQIFSIQKRKAGQYLGEGISFMAVIVVGAIFIYRATRKQIKFAQQQQNFMMAITHELKTPIAVAQLNLETLQKRKLDECKQAEMLSNAVFEVHRLNNLCNNILWAAQLEDDNFSDTTEEINLSETVYSCVNDVEKRYGQGKLQVDIEDNIYLKSDVLMMQILASNLIENALKYSSKEKSISISLSQINNAILFIVKDEGVGIAEDEKKKVFEKFYRIGSETTRKTKGTGLGLYLCKKICNKHKATIVITNNLPSGCIFTVTF